MSDEQPDRSSEPVPEKQVEQGTPPEDQRSNRPQKGKHHKKGYVRSPIRLTEREVQARFVACGRCGAFFAGYRALHGAQHVAEAIQESDDGWLTFNWDRPTRYLIYKSYGTRYEEDIIGFERMCQDCGRRFNYREAEEADETPYFRMEVKLR